MKDAADPSTNGRLLIRRTGEPHYGLISIAAAPPTLIDAFRYLQKGSTAVSCGLYRSAAGTYTLRVYRNGLEYRHSKGDEAHLRREAASKLEALLATNWEQIKPALPAMAPRPPRPAPRPRRSCRSRRSDASSSAFCIAAR